MTSATPTPLTISVIIPVLNERESLPSTIAALHSCRGISEIIVSDGGSTDGTLEWLKSEQLAWRGSQPKLTVLNAPRGKGPQLNAGAATASANVLLFLHADCLITQAATDALRASLADPSVCGGGFYLRFAERSPRSLRMVAWGINLRARARQSATGDQGIFLRREAFHAIGGAPDWPLFEDVELVRRARQSGKFIVLKTPLTVSGRRYIQHGVFRTALLIYCLRLAYRLGVSPLRLKNWFRDARGG